MLEAESIRTQRLSRAYRRFFADRPLARAVAVLAGGAAAGQSLTVLAMPILTRIYTTAEFGQLQYYALSLMAVVSIAALRYETAILLPEDTEEAAGVLCAGLISTVLIVVIVSGAIFVLGRVHLFDGDRAPLRPYAWILPVSIVGASVYQTLTYWAVREHDFKRIARTRIAQSLVQSGSQLALGFGGLGLGGLIVGDALGRMTGSFELARAAWNRSSDLFRRVSWRSIRSAGYRYRHFPLVSSGSALINTAGLTFPPFVVGGFYGANTLGLFGLVDRALALPALLIGQAISQVYMSRAARLVATDPTGFRAFYWSSAQRLAFIGLFPYLAVLIAGPQLFSLVFGHPWREAGVYARMLAIAQFAGFVSWPLLATLNILERQSWQLAWDAARLGATAGAVVAAHALGWSARGAIGAYAFALTLGYLAHIVLSRAAIRLRIQSDRDRIGPGSTITEQALGIGPV